MKKRSYSSLYKSWQLSMLCIIFIFAAVISSCGTNTAKNKNAPKQAASARHRQIVGIATDLGAGTFRVGRDVPAGLYDVTPKDGQGNLAVTSSRGDLLINEILGDTQGIGVNKVRTKISDGDEIKLQGISKTHFEPVSTPFVTTVKNMNLYSGRFTVGEDIAAGRFKASVSKGNGNFVVYDKSNIPITNEILGQSIGVRDITMDLKDGDIIAISSLKQVNLTPVK